eukprot:8030171-Lingulodinium_polyedra.AAC.1
MEHLEGSPWNSPKGRREAEAGTAMCERSVHPARALHGAARGVGVVLPITLENPAPPEGNPRLPSSF